MASPSEEPVNREETPEVEVKMYKTKIIKFLGRTTPIIVQDDYGPCPLIAVCNILLLRNKLGLSPDVKEVSQERLFTLVAESLIASNSNNKDAGSVNNQLQRIADAIDMLPSFATGLDVNLRFKRIDEFEVTRERSVFDLLDIPVYHGWIVDPQDSDTSNAFGSKCFNTVMEELIALQTKYKEALKLTETVNPNSDVDNSGPNIRYDDDWVKFETDPGEDICSSVEADKASHGGQVNPSESSKHESKDGIALTSIEVVKKTEKSDGDSSSPRIRYNDDWVTFENDPGTDVCSSLKANNASHGGEMNTSESQKPESCSSAHNAALELLKDMTDGITVGQGDLIRNFLRSNATQLSRYGLFRLQNDVKEGELCVLFRNNHFNTMFKFEGELYTLVTDEGYISSPGVIWEKLNEVNGDTWWANQDFKSFKAAKCEIEEIGSSDEDNANLASVFEYLANPDKRAAQGNTSLDEDNANLASVFEYLANPDKRAAQGNTSLKSDMHFAKTLQRQEFEERHVVSRRLPPATFPSGFIVGPEHDYSSWPRNRSSLSRSRRESKRLKEKCTLM